MRRLAHRVADRMIVISRVMKKNYRKAEKLLRLPPLIDTDDEIWHQMPAEHSGVFEFCFAGIPDGKKEYNEDYDIDKVREDIDKYMTIPDALAISDFFVKRQTGLSIVLVSFIKKTALATRMPRQQRKQVRKEWRKAMRDIIGDLHRYL